MPNVDAINKAPDSDPNFFDIDLKLIMVRHLFSITEILGINVRR